MTKAPTNARSARRRTDEKKRKLLVPLDAAVIDQLLGQRLVLRAGFERYRLSRAGKTALLRFLDAKMRGRTPRPGR